YGDSFYGDLARTRLEELKKGRYAVAAPPDITRLVNYLADEFLKEQGIDLLRDPYAIQRLKGAAEKAKIELSSNTQTEIYLPFITANASGPKHLKMMLTRAKFEHLIRP